MGSSPLKNLVKLKPGKALALASAGRFERVWRVLHGSAGLGKWHIRRNQFDRLTTKGFGIEPEGSLGKTGQFLNQRRTLFFWPGWAGVPRRSVWVFLYSNPI